MRLKASARKSILWRSAKGKERDTAMSTFHIPGPRIELRPPFPNVPTAPRTKADALNQRAIVGLLSLASPTTLGRSGPPVSELSVPTVTVEYVPVAAVKIVASCQFPASASIQREVNFGLLTTAERLNRCRRSDRQFAYSGCRF